MTRCANWHYRSVSGMVGRPAPTAACADVADVEPCIAESVGHAAGITVMGRRSHLLPRSLRSAVRLSELAGGRLRSVAQGSVPCVHARSADRLLTARDLA